MWRVPTVYRNLEGVPFYSFCPRQQFLLLVAVAQLGVKAEVQEEDVMRTFHALAFHHARYPFHDGIQD